MEIYVKSRGLQRDYYWVAKKNNQSIEENPEDIFTQPTALINEAIDLVEEKDFSLVLFRSQDGKLLLLVTGLKTQRQDIQTRYIRNSIAWIARDDDDDEFALRQIAALALQNELEQKIDVAINNSSGGFKVNWQAIEELLTGSSAARELLPEKKKIKKIGLILEERKQQLASTLLRYRLPSKKTGALVVVTGIKSKEALEASVVWRGLSNDPRNEEDLQQINWQSNQGMYNVGAESFSPLQPSRSHKAYSRDKSYHKIRKLKFIKLTDPKFWLLLLIIILAGRYTFLKFLLNL